MYRARFKLEGPVAPLVGSLVGGFVGGGMTVAGMTTLGGFLGSAVGSAVAGSLLGGKHDTPSYPTIAAPNPPGTPTAPQSQAAAPLPMAGENSPATAADIAKGEASSILRRGRLSTILSARNTAANTEEAPVERLGG